jgi:hypothetical protein
MSCFLDVVVNGITGDCLSTSTGAFTIDIDGTAPGYAFQWISPYTSVFAITGNSVSFSGLSAGTYTFQVTDSCSPINNQSLPINVYISSGTCVSIFSKTNTTCNEGNGSISAIIQQFYGNIFYELYEINDGLQQTLSPPFDVLSPLVTFTNLTPGTYYVVADDGGGCTGKTESCIIKSSTTLNFGLYTQNTSDCGVNTGSIYVTGLTGTPPFIYGWSNGSSTSFITGLTSGDYSVTIQDGSGCITSVGTTISSVPQVLITSLITTPPSCFSADGEVIVTLTGGTPPYYFSGTNGETSITFGSSYTFTGLSSGYFGVKVTDAGLCNNSTYTSLFTPNSFSVVSVSTTNSICNNNGGSIDIFLVGGSGDYTYTLIDSSGNTTSVVVPNTNYSFSNLSSGVYTLTISNNGSCTYTQNYTINNTILFTLSATTTGTTCDNSDGVVTLTISSGGTPPFFYQINGQSVTTSLLSYTFSGLSSGNYIATVTDAFFCEQLVNFFIPSSNNVFFNLAGVGPTLGQSNGYVEAFITSGEPPFTLNWTNTPSGQTGTTITGLTAGTYSLSVIDDNGCEQSRDITIYGINQYSSYQLFNVSNSDLEFNGVVSKRGIKQYLIDGFFDLTSGDTGCLLEQAVFQIEATLTGTTLIESFFTGTTLFDYPTDNEMWEAIQNLLLEFDGINSVEVDPLNNTLIVETIPNPPLGLIDATLSISLKIYYEINCVSCT